jgi:hypothetical protein
MSLLFVAFGSNIWIRVLDQDRQHETMTKETPMEATNRTRSRKIFRIIMFGFLATVAIAAAGAATSN